MKAMMTRMPRSALAVAFGVLLAGGFGLLFAGCRGGSGGPDDTGLLKLKVAYIGLTCEPPIFVAYENGFFKEEGLDVELVKTDWDGLQAGLGLGRFHANHTLLMYAMKPIESGLDVKITGGVHTGCLRIQAGIKTGIHTVADLKGRKIGIASIGSPPHLFASRVLAVQGMDPKKDVEWVVHPPDTAELYLDKGLIDAVASAEPIGTILTIREKVRTVSDQAVDAAYRDEYCCAVVVNGQFARDNPAGAAKVTRAMFKAAKWVAANPTAAARMAVEKKYLAASPEINAQAIAKLDYSPGVAKCRKDLDRVTTDMQKAGFLKASTDPAELAKKAWVDLEGVTDDWIKGVRVEKVEGGGIPPRMDVATLNAILADLPACCKNGPGRCCDSEKSVFALPAEWAAVRPTRLNPVQSVQGETILVSAGR
jgi:NitT/TauT family transport system substrate-binding protein